MSLLNDALRKRDRERRPAGEIPAGPAVAQAPLRRGSRVFKLAVLAAGLLFVGALGVAFLLPIRPAPSNPGSARASVVAIPATNPQTAPPSAETAPVAAAAAAASPLAGHDHRGQSTEGPEDDPAVAAAAAPAQAGQPAAENTANIAAAGETPAPLPDEPTPPVPASPEGPPPESPRRHPPGPVAAKAPAPVEAPTPVERYYRKARSSHRQGRLERAVALYREVLRLAPRHTEARFNLASAYIDLRAFDKAAAIAEELHLQQPDSPQVLINLAIARIGLKRYGEALQLLDRAQASPRASPFTIWLHKGIACRGLGQLEAAVGWYHKAEALNPDHPRLLFNMALAYDRLEAYRQAVHYYEAYLRQAATETDQPRKDVRRRMTALRAYLASGTLTGEQAP